MKKKKVVIALSDGAVEAVRIPKGIKVEIRDYDRAKTWIPPPESKFEAKYVEDEDLGRHFFRRVVSRKGLLAKK